MDILQAEQIMFDRLVTAWGSTTVLVLPNEAAPEPIVAWVQADIVAVDEPQVSLGPVGGRRFERRHLLTLEIHVPRDSGVTPMSTLRKLVTTTFENFRSGELWVTEVVARNQLFDGLSYVVQCDVGFNFHEIK